MQSQILELPNAAWSRSLLTERDQEKYNLARGIMAAVNNREATEQGSTRRVTSFETEISDALQRASGSESHGGLFVPWSIRHRWAPVVQRRSGLDSGTATAGAELKFTAPGEFLKFLYNQTRVKQLGARTVAGLRQNVSYPVQTGKGSGSWVSENPGSDVSDSALTLGTIASSPKTYQSTSSYSRQLLAQSAVDVDTLVREDLARDMALAIDSVAIVGGGSNQPTGIVATSGVQSYSTLADSGNGGVLTWDDIVEMSQKLEDANTDQLGDGAWLTTPGVKSSLKRIARLGNTIGLPIWADDDTIDGFPAASSNQVSKTGSKGSGTNLHTLIRGVFNQLVISLWGQGFELIVDPYRLKKQGMIELTTFMLTDVTVKYPAAFVVAKYISTI